MLCEGLINSINVYEVPTKYQHSPGHQDPAVTKVATKVCPQGTSILTEKQWQEQGSHL